MEPSEAKQHLQSQNIGVFMVVFGMAALYAGCRYHFPELSTAAALVNGAGINMLTNQIRNTLNNRDGAAPGAPSSPNP